MKPKVTIDLEEYESLKKTIEDKETKIATIIKEVCDGDSVLITNTPVYEYFKRSNDYQAAEYYTTTDYYSIVDNYTIFTNQEIFTKIERINKKLVERTDNLTSEINTIKQMTVKEFKRWRK